VEIMNYILLGLIIACAVSVSLTKNLLASIIIFMSQGLIMSVVWILLRSPDLAITEAAVGAGVTSLLLFVALKKLHAINTAEEGTHDRKE
jgi:energy-converting hydrogenase B subunit D